MEFADGSACGARLSAEADPLLETDAYMTARGTEVPARRWRLRRDGEGWRARRA